MSSPHFVLRLRGAKLACFAPACKRSELDHAWAALRAAGIAARIRRARCRLHGFKINGFDLLVSPRSEDALLAAVCAAPVAR